DVSGLLETLAKSAQILREGFGRCGVQKSDHRECRLLRARRQRPRSRTTEQGYELAASHCPMPPVLPTERIAHLGTADCCIHRPGRNETIAVTPPIIFSKGGSPKQATPLPRQQPPSPPGNRFTPNFRGWRLDEDLKKVPPTGGAHIDVRWQDKNEVGLAA